MTRRRVIIESPSADHGDPDKRRLFDAYLRLCIKDSLKRGEAPFASHGFYPWVLDDEVPTERDIGMAAGFAWGEVADTIAVYKDLGVSLGMYKGIAHAKRHLITIEYRQLFPMAGVTPSDA